MELESWEKEVLAGHRWGQHGKDRAEAELARLKELREAAGPMDDNLRKLIAQIIGPEICNWRLEEMTRVLCDAIGEKKPLPYDTGHGATVTDELRGKAWAYYLLLRHWQHNAPRSGFRTLLLMCDPDGSIEKHVREMLGGADELKSLRVERLCQCLEALLGERYPEHSPQAKAHAAAVAAVEKDIRRIHPEAEILQAIREYREGDHLAYIGLEFCHHKFFRRLDIIISSIGVGKWRGAMPVEGTDRIERAETVEAYLRSMEAWLDRREPCNDGERDVARRLGKPDATKVFLASLLASLLRAQALAARKRAEETRETDRPASDGKTDNA